MGPKPASNVYNFLTRVKPRGRGGIGSNRLDQWFSTNFTAQDAEEARNRQEAVVVLDASDVEKPAQKKQKKEKKEKKEKKRKKEKQAKKEKKPKKERKLKKSIE